ncbi:unnamed protein product [Alopecurus aequalis]
MAAPNSWTHEIESSVTAPRLFRAAVLDWHTLAPKLTSHIVASVEFIEGDGSKAGSVRQLNFTPVMPFKYVKERLDLLDTDKCESKSTLIEGGQIGISIETATMHFKIEPANGGSVVKVSSTYKLLPGVQVKDDEITMAKESVTAIFTTAEAYLIANSDAYI